MLKRRILETFHIGANTCLSKEWRFKVAERRKIYNVEAQVFAQIVEVAQQTQLSRESVTGALVHDIDVSTTLHPPTDGATMT